MDVIFIRHASAEPAGAGGDAARKLTRQGRTEARATAKGLKAMGVEPDLILTSPLARASATAEIAAEVLDGVRVEPLDMLAGPAKCRALRRRLAALAGEGMSTVALVGHAPSMDQYVGDLVARTTAAGVSLSKAGAACVAMPPDGDCELRWLLRRKHLRMLAGPRGRG